MNETVLFSYRDDDLHFHHTVTQIPDPEQYPFRLHSHVMHEIFYFVSGNAEYTVEGTTYPLEKGTLILSAGCQLHHLGIHSKTTPYERIVLMFSPSLLSPTLEELIYAAESGSHVFRLSEREQIWFEENCLTLENSKFTKEETRKAVNALLTLTLTRFVSCPIYPVSGESPKSEIVQQILHCITRNLTGELSLEMLERELFRDRAYLNRSFKQVMGCSIWEYVIRKRIFNARQQLYLSGNIAEAFRCSGFTDYSVFYRNYVRCIGRSPSADLKTLRT